MPEVESFPLSSLKIDKLNPRLSNSEKPIYVVSIDIGTNSKHLLVASVDVELRTFTTVLAEKSTTRLGERDPESGNLTMVAMERVFETLKRFKELATSHKVRHLVTAATSAVREAPNGRDFLKTVKVLKTKFSFHKIQKEIKK